MLCASTRRFRPLVRHTIVIIFISENASLMSAHSVERSSRCAYPQPRDHPGLGGGTAVECMLGERGSSYWNRFFYPFFWEFHISHGSDERSNLPLCCTRGGALRTTVAWIGFATLLGLDQLKPEQF